LKQPLWLLYGWTHVILDRPLRIEDRDPASSIFILDSTLFSHGNHGLARADLLPGVYQLWAQPTKESAASPSDVPN
jgi:hypothetical protein